MHLNVLSAANTHFCKQFYRQVFMHFKLPRSLERGFSIRPK